MECLQYLAMSVLMNEGSTVLNLVINGMPSILGLKAIASQLTDNAF